MSLLNIWIKALRLRTLPLALAGISTGAALSAESHKFQGLLLFLLMLTAILLQILSNLANDYGDFKKGTDQGHRTDRMMASGHIQEPAMKRALMFFAAASLISGISALRISFPDSGFGFWLFFLLGLAAIVAAVNYTVGKKPYGYYGLGDVFVFVFFGCVAVLGSAFLLSRTFQISWIFPAGTIGFLSVAVLHVNNLRDIETDQKVGKRTVAVILGKERAIKYQWILYGLSIVCIGIFSHLSAQVPVLLSLIVPVFQMYIWNRIVSNPHSGKNDFNRMLKIQALGTFLFSLLFSLLYLL